MLEYVVLSGFYKYYYALRTTGKFWTTEGKWELPWLNLVFEKLSC
jgi:hypothetical protein